MVWKSSYINKYINNFIVNTLKWFTEGNNADNKNMQHSQIHGDIWTSRYISSWLFFPPLQSLQIY